MVRAGVGQIGVIEYDKVNLSNIHRQTLYSSKDINKYKTEILRKRVKLINNELKLKIFNEKAEDKNLKKFYEI